jgi:hypothetical protein
MPFVRATRPSVAAAAQLWPLARDAVFGLAAAVDRRRSGVDELEEARELLAYWERRARRLPHWSVLRRREARAAARIWRERVAEGERRRYGAGMLGAVSLYAAERRLPVTTAHRSHQLAKLAGWTALTVLVAVLVLVAAAAAVVVQTAFSIL